MPLTRNQWRTAVQEAKTDLEAKRAALAAARDAKQAAETALASAKAAESEAGDVFDALRDARRVLFGDDDV